MIYLPWCEKFKVHLDPLAQAKLRAREDFLVDRIFKLQIKGEAGITKEKGKRMVFQVEKIIISRSPWMKDVGRVVIMVKVQGGPWKWLWKDNGAQPQRPLLVFFCLGTTHLPPTLLTWFSQGPPCFHQTPLLLYSFLVQE